MTVHGIEGIEGLGELKCLGQSSSWSCPGFAGALGRFSTLRL